MIRVNSQSFSLSSTLRKKTHDDTEQHRIIKSQSFPIQSKRQPKISDSFRLHYVTQRIFASILPRRNPRDCENNNSIGRSYSEGASSFEDEYEKELIALLEQKHGKNYRIFDLESCISIITLERICELCKHIDSWLGSGEEKVVVLQDREDRQRLGTAIAAYMNYLDICASNYVVRKRIKNEDIHVQNTIERNWLDLDIFSMKKFLDDFINPLRVPSYKRYLSYFSGLLSGKIKINSKALHLKFVTLNSPPWLQSSHLSSGTSEWNSFIKIYEGLHCVYTSDIHIIPITTRQCLYQVGNLSLRGDIIVRCYQISMPENNYNSEVRELLSSVQFHTCAITTNEVIFSKNDLDFGCDDQRFPNDHKISLYFNNTDRSENNYTFQSPMVRTEPPNDLAKYDSIENFDITSSYHTQGPVDGSLYATILKSPKSPQSSNQQYSTSPSSSQRCYSFQNLISPPSQFSNRQYDIIERTPISATPVKSSIQERSEIITTSAFRANSPKANYGYPDIQLGTSQLNSRTSRTTNHYLPSYGQPNTFIETYSSTNGGRHSQTFSNVGCESVRSPLTLSIDSGISSSSVLNKPQQAFSISPSSFPSQVSPQEDRHRELDDILSDMLMTVSDIPNFSKTYKQGTTSKKIACQSVIPTSGSFLSSATSNQHHFNSHDYDGDILKRSKSYAINNTLPNSNSYLIKDRDHCDTSSTTTTLTPPASESGRDTPTTICGSVYSENNSAILLQHRPIHQRERRDTYLLNNINQRAMIMDLQCQSSSYPETARSETVVVSEDEDIPYHAREHSQPFTYGNIPSNSQLELQQTDPNMIKMQSGLSSPSLVRKQIGGIGSSAGISQTLRKTKPRLDFEEMLRERREKVMSEKYGINDEQSSVDKNYNNSYVNNDSKWSSNSSLNQSNVYHHYNESLKRSNTMDGTFVRSNSADGISRQTWLQLQQQKLRAKKGQQFREDRRNFEEIYAGIRNSSLRSRANASQRFEGYTSDTGAFGDEVDYRRPLHIQTPYNSNRSPELHYHASRTKVSQKEQPFVAVQRANEVTKYPIEVREESFSSYRSETDPELSTVDSTRPDTPAFPVTPRTPYVLSTNGNISPALPPKSPTIQRKDLFAANQKEHLHEVDNQNDTINYYTSRRNSNISNGNSEPHEVAPHHVKFVRDSSKFWYKPTIKREEAVSLLRNATPGSFIVRDSTTFKNAFGLVLRVAHPPPGIQSKGNGGDELVRHFLVEPTSRGVRLKGCGNEPVFTSLSALVYQHSTTPLALPCRLIIPERDIQAIEIHSPAQKQLLAQGAACNVLYLFTYETESLTGEEAVRKSVSKLFASKPLPKPTEVHFKVSSQGITLTDNTRQKFFRKHYSASVVSFCGLDPDKRLWSIRVEGDQLPVENKTIFAFVARRSASSSENQCHVFSDLMANQPATAIISFANKVLPSRGSTNQHI